LSHTRKWIGAQPLGIQVELSPGAQQENLQIKRVLKGSLAEKAGVLAEDIVTAINGKKVSDLEGEALGAELSKDKVTETP
jgi:S1-C subfamily serine protease